MFRGRYQFVEAEIQPPPKHLPRPEHVVIRSLDEKIAANPDTVVGVVVDLQGDIDRILVMGDDAYEMGKMPLEYLTKNSSHAWSGSEGFGFYWINAKPAGTAQIIMDLLDLDEK